MHLFALHMEKEMDNCEHSRYNETKMCATVQGEVHNSPITEKTKHEIKRKQRIPCLIGTSQFQIPREATIVNTPPRAHKHTQVGSCTAVGSGFPLGVLQQGCSLFSPQRTGQLHQCRLGHPTHTHTGARLRACTRTHAIRSIPGGNSSLLAACARTHAPTAKSTY